MDPVDEVCIACRQEAILRGKENTDKRASDCSVNQNHQKEKENILYLLREKSMLLKKPVVEVIKKYSPCVVHTHSSRTRKRTWDRLSFPVDMRSSSLPGVPTMMSI